MTERMPKALYERELISLQAKLVDMQAWVQQSGARVVVIFEGRDAAGKGSTIKRVSEYMNPRVTRIVALPTPSARDKTRRYFQRYVPHLLSKVPYERIEPEPLVIPPRPAPGGYERPPRDWSNIVPDHAQELIDGHTSEG